jgi:GDP-L-fucose synthase
VAGHRGMVGSAIVRNLLANGYRNIITKNHDELDLTNQKQVVSFFEKEKPDQVYLAAAKVGGIYANNTYPAEFIYQNLMIEANVIHQAFSVGVKKLLFLGSSCIYPKFAPQPMNEDVLLSGKLEPTNEPYAISKIAGIKLCESYNRQYGLSHGIDYRSVMPTNLYGYGDNFHVENSHVIPGLIYKMHHAKLHNLKEVIIWGSGNQTREFLHCDDLASACSLIMNIKLSSYQKITSDTLSHINIGSSEEISIKNLALLISEIVEYRGEIKFDLTKEDGPPRKSLMSKKLSSLGWKPEIKLKEGLKATYQDFKKNLKK